jgi:hypothetical protein
VNNAYTSARTLIRLNSHRTVPHSIPADWNSHLATKSAAKCGRIIAEREKGKSFIMRTGEVGNKGEQIQQCLSSQFADLLTISPKRILGWNLT